MKSRYSATVSFTKVVDNLSKRVPSSALRELFDHFGRVTDVCVAYFNPRRKYSLITTFAFDRFWFEEDLHRAIAMGAIS